MIGQVLLWCGDDISTANQAYLMHVRQDVCTHTFLKIVHIVVPATVEVGCVDTVGSDGTE